MAHMHRALYTVHTSRLFTCCASAKRRDGDETAEQELVELIRKTISKNIERINLVADFFPVTHLAPNAEQLEQLVRDERYEKLSVCARARAVRWPEPWLRSALSGAGRVSVPTFMMLQWLLTLHIKLRKSDLCSKCVYTLH